MSEKADDLRFYETIRARIEHEDDLIVQRLSWFMASQAFLFTAYAIALNGPSYAAKLLRLVPVVGMISAAVIYAGIFAAPRAMAWIRSTFDTRGVTEAGLGLPPLLTPMPIRLFGLAAPVLLPGVFLLAWLFLFAT